MTVIIKTTGTSWTVPADFNKNNNPSDGIGGGGGGGGEPQEGHMAQEGEVVASTVRSSILIQGSHRVSVM